MGRLIKVSLWVAAAGVLAFGVIQLGAYPTGITGVTLKSSTPGCTCHSLTPSSSVNVTISGPASLAPSEGGSYAVEVRGGPLQAAGTNIAASAGSLSPVDASLQKIGDELTHAAPKAPAGEVVRFDFSYTAPTDPGQTILYANGNSVNDNGLNTGDSWNYANNLVISVQPTTGVASLSTPSSFGLDQNYPNPFNPSTTINFALPVSAFVTLSVYDLSGQQVAVILSRSMEAGYKTVQWTAGALSSGMYFYRLEARAQNDRIQFSGTRRFVLIR